MSFIIPSKQKRMEMFCAVRIQVQFSLEEYRDYAGTHPLQLRKALADLRV